MKSLRFSIVFLFLSMSCMPQKSIEKTLDKLNDNSIPYIFVNELKMGHSYIILDTRKRDEFEVSHLPGAKWVGYNSFDLPKVSNLLPNKEKEIVVYCSIGVRSEDIGEKLKKAGYTNVKNLYGGIFEWKNQGKPVVDMNGNETEKVHAYNKYWGKLLKNGQKIYKNQ